LAELVEHTGEKRNACRVLKAKPEGKRPLGILRKHSIRIYLKEIGWKSVDWANLFQDREKCRALVKTQMNSGFTKYGDYHA
jgi:hypothetical protein